MPITKGQLPCDPTFIYPSGTGGWVNGDSLFDGYSILVLQYEEFWRCMVVMGAQYYNVFTATELYT